ncbi:MAG TPA: hypothetical protein VD905_17430 [Flavobacteriales bacterium]|nr:hypothetical protein [Flavobacteriales bacterium]
MSGVIDQNDILKEENVGYLKSKMNLLQGKLSITANHLVLTAHKTTVNLFGVIGALLKSRVEKEFQVFKLSLKDIQKIENGKHGMNKGVLEITDNKNQTYRILVKNYADWENTILTLKN